MTTNSRFHIGKLGDGMVCKISAGQQTTWTAYLT